MKTILKIFVILTLFSLSCEDEGYYIDCAALDQGDVMIQNDTQLDLLVDVTTGSQKKNEPILLDADRVGVSISTIFQEIPKGEAKVWWSLNGEDWNYKFVDVKTCERTYCRIKINDVI